MRISRNPHFHRLTKTYSLFTETITEEETITPTSEITTRMSTTPKATTTEGKMLVAPLLLKSIYAGVRLGVRFALG